MVVLDVYYFSLLENIVAINTCPVTRIVMKVLLIMSRMLYFIIYSHMHTAIGLRDRGILLSHSTGLSSTR